MSDSNSPPKLPLPILVIVILLGSVLVGGGAYFVANKLVSPSSQLSTNVPAVPTTSPSNILAATPGPTDISRELNQIDVGSLEADFQLLNTTSSGL